MGPRLEPPKLVLTSIEVGAIQGLSQEFIIGVSVANPNAKALALRGVSYSLALNSFELIQGVSAEMC